MNIQMEIQRKLPVEKKHKQDWHKYNLAKTNEKRLFYELLNDLANIIKSQEYHFGRPAIPIRDLFFCMGLKLYSNYGGRKAASDVKSSKEAGYISTTPHYNTITEFLACPATYELLSKMVTISAMPLRHLEDKFSLDSSGFGSYQYERWQRVRLRNSKHRNYLKGHILIGTRTNIVCSCEITPGNFSDVRQAPALILKSAANFNMKEISADKAYSSKLIHRIIYSIGAIPYIPFKKNIKSANSKDTPIWNEMFLMFKNNQEEWRERYNKRSNVETVFSMIKVRLGEFLRCKEFESQRNELMMKFICHNICCLIQEMYENNVKVDFDKCNKLYFDQKVPEEYITRDAGKIQESRDKDFTVSGK